MPDRAWRQLGMRTILLLGFGVTFGIWLFAGNFFLNRIRETETRTAAVNVRYMQAQELLSTVRAQALLASVYVRDALLDPNPAATDYRGQVNAAYETINKSLSQYEPVLDSTEERERVERLRRQLEDFRETMLQVLGTDSTRWPVDARILLRTVVVPKRELVIQVSEEVQALNRAAFVQQQQAVAAIYSLSQRRLWQSLGIALAASFGVGLLVAAYAGRLETRLREQRAREAFNARELQELSAKLITVQEEERRAIARELHDEVGQALTAIKVELAVAERVVGSGLGNPDVLRDARSITEGALTTVRDLSLLLHPSMLDDLGLPAAIEWYLRGFSRRYDIRGEFFQAGVEDRLVQEVEASSYRIVQEALTNVAKHARASQCSVRLSRIADNLEVMVDDDGVGFDANPKAASRSGLGLIGIRERAARLHGTVTIESAPGKGTRLTVRLPARSRTGGEAGSTSETASTIPSRAAREIETLADG